jgi:cobalt-zinc-cadmium efflux system membrane fusion protein
MVLAGEDHGRAAPASAGSDKHHDEVKLTADAISKFNIKIGTAEEKTLMPTFVAPARVAFNAEAMAHVGAAVRGRATEIKVRVGDAVKKGDELITVESPELGQAQSEFLQKRTAVAVALAGVEPAKNAYERAKALYEKNEGIALAEVQKREADLKAAAGAHQSAVAAMTAAENALHLMGMDQDAVQALAKTTEITPRYSIRAPLDGQVIDREVTLGELVSPEKEALLILANMNTLWVLADVPEARLPEVAVGAKARVQVSALKGEGIDGTVSHIAPSIDPETRSGRVRIEVSNGHTPLRPGMFARVWISTAPKDAKPVLAVPEEAIQTVEGEPAVFVRVEGEENTFAKRVVQVGNAVGGMVPVLSGLKPGDKLVVSGSFILKADLSKNEAGHEH